jgi:hypothetical protein
MKTKLARVPIALAAIALTLSPAMAKSKRHHHRANPDYYDQTYGANAYQNGWNNGYGWNSRNVSGSDPSFSNRAGINAAQRSGRCVEDLGYGRYEYCDW